MRSTAAAVHAPPGKFAQARPSGMEQSDPRVPDPEGVGIPIPIPIKYMVDLLNIWKVIKYIGNLSNIL